ncbi:MAG: metallophosphoesterase family protein [bacterium]
MRYAIVSDIHANLPAWKAVLRDIKLNGADEIICLGDVVGYGPMPRAVLDDVHEHIDQMVIGNHDAVVCGRFDENNFTESARKIIQWTRDQLSDEAVSLFSSLPSDLAGDGFAAAHAEIADPERFGYIEDEQMARESFIASDATMIFVGHTHLASIFIQDILTGSIYQHHSVDFSAATDMRYIVNVGSVGDPRDRDDIRACYCLYDVESKEVTYRRVPFDLATYRLGLKQSGLSIYPYFLSSVDGHPEVIPVQDWKPKIVVRPTRSPAGIKLSRSHLARVTMPGAANPNILCTTSTDEKKKHALVRKHKGFIARERQDLADAHREKQELAAKLTSMQKSALARRRNKR